MSNSKSHDYYLALILHQTPEIVSLTQDLTEIMMYPIESAAILPGLISNYVRSHKDFDKKDLTLNFDVITTYVASIEHESPSTTTDLTHLIFYTHRIHFRLISHYDIAITIFRAPSLVKYHVTSIILFTQLMHFIAYHKNLTMPQFTYEPPTDEIELFRQIDQFLIQIGAEHSSLLPPLKILRIPKFHSISHSIGQCAKDRIIENILISISQHFPHQLSKKIQPFQDQPYRTCCTQSHVHSFTYETQQLTHLISYELYFSCAFVFPIEAFQINQIFDGKPILPLPANSKPIRNAIPNEIRYEILMDLVHTLTPFKCEFSKHGTYVNNVKIPPVVITPLKLHWSTYPNSKIELQITGRAQMLSPMSSALPESTILGSFKFEGFECKILNHKHLLDNVDAPPPGYDIIALPLQLEDADTIPYPKRIKVIAFHSAELDKCSCDTPNIEPRLSHYIPRTLPFILEH